MPNPYVEGFKVRIVGSIHGQQTVNVLHFGSNVVLHDDLNNLNTFLEELAQAVLDCVVNSLLPAVSSDWRINKVEANRIFPTASDPIEVVSTTEVFGELPPASHSFAASLVNLRSGIGGRHGRGRIFLAPPGEANVTASDIDGPTLALIAAFLTCMLGKFLVGTGSTNFEWIVLSRTLAGANNANFNAGAFPIKTATPASQAAVMSSRRKGRGN